MFSSTQILLVLYKKYHRLIYPITLWRFWCFTESQTSSHRVNSAEEIVENLPKVWKVLIELLSHQSAPVNVLTEEEANDSENPCYKLVQTPKGSRLVLSVSQTFIRLKVRSEILEIVGCFNVFLNDRT